MTSVSPHRQGRLAPGPDVCLQPRELRAKANGLEQGIAFEPHEARKAGVGGRSEPANGRIDLAELSVRRAEAVCDVMVAVVASHDTLNVQTGGGDFPQSSQDTGKRRA